MAAATSVPKVFTGDREIDQLQTNILGPLNRLLGLPLNSGQQLVKVNLASGANTVPHGLGRELQGWFLVRLRASATVFDTQDSNPTPAKTLLLTASAAATVDLYVY